MWSPYEYVGLHSVSFSIHFSRFAFVKMASVHKTNIRVRVCKFRATDRSRLILWFDYCCLSSLNEQLKVQLGRHAVLISRYLTITELRIGEVKYKTICQPQQSPLAYMSAVWTTLSKLIQTHKILIFAGMKLFF